MNRNLIVSSVAVAALVATVAAAQSGSASGQATSQGQGSASTPSTQVSSGAEATTSAQATVDVSALRQRVTEKASKIPAQARTKADARLDAVASKTDEAASKQGESTVAARLAGEFGMSSEALAAEKQTLGTSWGNLMIAHTLASNTKTDLTVAQLIAMKQGGMGWGQIAAGLGLNLGSSISSVMAENRVAAGLAKADGKVAVIHSEGARTGAGAAAGLHAGAAAGAAGANAHAGAGLGIKVGK